MRAMRTPVDSIYPDARLFLDYVAGHAEVVERFQWRVDAVSDAVAARSRGAYPRDALADRLGAYNRGLGAAPIALTNAERLADPSTLCVVGGQQAGFLGGPAYTAYKIHSILRVAEGLARSTGRPVVPVFWLATEDHDLNEINRVRVQDDEGRLATVVFDGEDTGRAIESFSISPAMIAAADPLIAHLPKEARQAFRPEPGDDYATWHARIWSRLFSDQGLVLVEPRTIRPLTEPLCRQALSRGREIQAALASAAEALGDAGYVAPLDPAQAGRPFAIDEKGRRVRASGASVNGDLSPDAALRPVLADAVLPSVAQVLGPGEIAYQAMLRPVYELFDVIQPLIVPRQGATVVSAEDMAMLSHLGVEPSAVVCAGFDMGEALDRLADPGLASLFGEVRAGVGEALSPLAKRVSAIDSGLDARYRQTAARVDTEIQRLADRAMRADLGRRGISVRQARELVERVRPGGKPQERLLSAFELTRRYGLEWLGWLPWDDAIGSGCHHVVCLEGAE